jgi:V-type H+-transporting ATPase subunit A
MENIFDGIQRPLEVIFDGAGQSPFVPLGVDIPALSSTRKFVYKSGGVREGQIVTGGTILGEVYENELMRSHKIMVPPDVFGEVVAIYHGNAKSGHSDGNEELTIHEPLLRIKQDDTGEMIDVSMSHKWPVRKPRPVAEKLTGKEALITG